MVDELVVEDVVDAGALGGVVVEDLGDQVAGLFADWHVFREGVGVHADTFVGRLHVRGLEGRLPDDQGVDYHTKRPYVYLVGVTLLSF